MKKIYHLTFLIAYELKTQTAFFLAFLVASVFFVSVFISTYLLPARLADSLERYAQHEGIFDIVITCDNAQELRLVSALPVVLYDDGGYGEYPADVTVYAESMAGYFGSIRTLQEHYISYFAVYCDEAQSLKLMRDVAYMIRIFFFVVVALMMNYALINMYLQKRKFFLAVLKTQGMSDRGLYGFVWSLMIVLQTCACAVSNAIFPHINAYIKNTVEEIFPYITMDLDVSLWDEGLCWGLLAIMVTISVWIWYMRSRRNNICLVLNRGEE